MAEVPSTTVSLSLNEPGTLHVAVAATDVNGDSGGLSTMLKVTTPPNTLRLLSPDYIPQDVVIVTDSADGEYILKWRQPAIPTDSLEVSSVSCQ